MKFEHDVLKALEARYNDVLYGVPFEFYSSYGREICIPDGLLLYEEQLVVVEIKLRHTFQAWQQLRYLYGPVVAQGFRRGVRLLEVCKWPSTEPWPREVEQFTTVQAFLRSTKAMGCVVWGKYGGV